MHCTSKDGMVDTELVKALIHQVELRTQMLHTAAHGNPDLHIKFPTK
jgi:hypothetical protein